jgi:hypothetical protein
VKAQGFKARHYKTWESPDPAGVKVIYGHGRYDYEWLSLKQAQNLIKSIDKAIKYAKEKAG